MATFVSFEEESGASRDTVYINVDQVSHARYDGQSKTLHVVLLDGQEFTIPAADAPHALPAFRARRP